MPQKPLPASSGSSGSSAPSPSHLPSYDGDLGAGDVVGDFRIARVAGRGLSSIVYLAHDLSLGRPVAVKEYWPHTLARRADGRRLVLRRPQDAPAWKRGLEQLLAEARQLSRFDHPSLVRVLRFWEENGTAYVAMPHVPGPNLLALRRGMAQPPDANWLLDHLLNPLLDLLQRLHGAGCIHGDLSPAHVLMTEGQRPVLLGLRGAAPTAFDGPDPAYAALEQFPDHRGLPVGPWTDLHSLSALAFLALTGSAPVAAPLRARTAAPGFAQSVRNLVALLPEQGYDERFLAPLNAAFACDPQARPRSVADWRQAWTSAPPAPVAPPASDSPGTPAPPGEDAARPSAEEPTEEAVLLAIRAAVDGLDFAPRPRRPDPGPIDPPAAAAAHVSAPSPMASTFADSSAQAGAAPPKGRRPPWAAIGGAAVLVLVVALLGWQWAAPAAPDAEAAPPAADARFVQPPARQPLIGTGATPPQPAPAPAPQSTIDRPVAPEPTPNVPPPLPPPKPTPKSRPAAPPASPREACGQRTNFSLYRCMQQQCAKSVYRNHAQCQLLREQDIVE